ncbi:MAG: hypothetical protein ABFD16_25915 [Thermoguttaceae bacterium]
MAKVRVKFTPQCQGLVEKELLSPRLVAIAINDRHQELIVNHGTRLVACHWFSDDLAILVDSEVTEAGDAFELGPLPIEEVTAQVVLSLRPELPAGHIDREMDVEDLLAIVAESFGIPLTCDPDEPLSTLYSGAGREDAVVVHSGCIPPEFWLIGSFDPHETHCELVWAFRPDRYRTWFESENWERPLQ